MASATACGRGPAAPSSSVAVPKAAAGSLPSGATPRPLRGRNAFSRIYQEGARCRRGGVTVVAAPAEPDGPLVGFVAGKRVGNAVRRNRAKRRLRAAVRRVALDTGTAYIVIAGPDVPDVEYRRLVGWLEAAIDGVSVAQEKESE